MALMKNGTVPLQVWLSSGCRLFACFPHSLSADTHPCVSSAGPPHQPGRVLGLLEHKPVVAVAAGREHALVATKDGEVFSFGGGRAVLGRAGSASEPALVAGALAGQVVRHVAAGEVRTRQHVRQRHSPGIAACMCCCTVCGTAAGKQCWQHLAACMCLVSAGAF